MIDDLRALLAAPVPVPGQDLRTSGTAWVDLRATDDTLTITILPVDGGDVGGLWVAAAQPNGRTHHRKVDRNGQCVLAGLTRGRWHLLVLQAEQAPAPPETVPEIGPLLDAISDDDPVAACEAMDAVRAAARGELWSSVDVEPVVAQLRNPEAIVRKAAAELLGEVGGPSAARPLVEATGDPVWFVQEAAVVSLGLIGADTTGVLAGIRADATRDPAVREAAEEVLVRHGQVVTTGPPPAHQEPFADEPSVQQAFDAAEQARRIDVIRPVAGLVVEVGGAAMFVHQHPSDLDAVVVSVEPGADLAGLTGSLWSTGLEAHVHTGRFDALGQLRLRGVDQELGYQLRIMDTSPRTVGALVTSSATPVPVRNSAEEGESVTLLVVSDQDGRRVAIRRIGGDGVVADVVGLGITDRRTVACLPIRTATGLQLLAPLRWNHLTDRCEARLRLSDTDEVTDEFWGVRTPDELEPELADAVTASVRRAAPGAWSALAAHPGLHARLVTAIRTAPRGER